MPASPFTVQYLTRKNNKAFYSDDYKLQAFIKNIVLHMQNKNEIFGMEKRINSKYNMSIVTNGIAELNKFAREHNKKNNFHTRIF